MGALPLHPVVQVLLLVQALVFFYLVIFRPAPAVCGRDAELAQALKDLALIKKKLNM